MVNNTTLEIHQLFNNNVFFYITYPPVMWAQAQGDSLKQGFWMGLDLSWTNIVAFAVALPAPPL